jgi:arylsulfatase A-like enzyme
MIFFSPNFRTASAFVAGLLFSLSVSALAEETSTSNRCNVLFICIDDLRTELGCYGVPDARSPHLDKLARSGVLFTNHFVQVPTCGASRYALLTGQSPGTSGVTRNNAAFYSGGSALNPKQQAGAQSLPELFRRSGYQTICIGKISHTPDGRVFAYNGSGEGRDELPGAWDELATPFGDWKRGWGTFFAYADGKHREDGKGHKDLMEFVTEKDTDLPDGLMAEAAIDKLKELKGADQPFFMGLGFFKPHLPFVATKQDWEEMEKVDVQAPANPEKVSSPYWHGSGEFYKYAATHKKTNPLATADQIKCRRAYLACVRYVDRQVGKVLDSLNELGLAENTVVVVWGDHGWQLGESALWGKHTPFERAVKSTLIIRAPGELKTGQMKPGHNDALVETVDLYPTLIDLCNPKFQETLKPLDGKTLLPLLSGTEEKVRDVATSYWGNAISLRTQTHRLIAKRSNKPDQKFQDVELYDVTKSADPVKNVAAEFPEMVQQLLNDVP